MKARPRKNIVQPQGIQVPSIEDWRSDWLKV